MVLSRLLRIHYTHCNDLADSYIYNSVETETYIPVTSFLLGA